MSRTHIRAAIGSPQHTVQATPLPNPRGHVSRGSTITPHLDPVLADPLVTLSVITPASPSPESPPAPSLKREVENVVRGIRPQVIILPEMSPGASDSRYTRALGMPSYGIDAMFDDLDDGRACGRDERIGVQAFDRDSDFTYRLMKELARS